ncbi:MAG: hypothetical protein QW156_04720 [Candidatus Aenigmatarchaeota archaeon]
MKYIIHILYIIAIIVLLLFLNRACNQVKEMTEIMTGAKSEAEQYKKESEKFKELLKKEMEKPPKIVVKTKIIERATGQGIIEVRPECQKCLDELKISKEVCDEDKGVCYKNEDILRNDGYFIFSNRFYDFVSSVYTSARISEQNRIFRWKTGLGASSHTGLFISLEILNLRGLAKIPIGIMGLIEYNIKNYQDSRIGIGLDWNFYGNLFVLGAYERSILHNYAVAGIGVFLN